MVSSATGLRLIFAGTPDFAAHHLQALIDCGHAYEIVAVYTQPDRPAGRGKKLQQSPVKALALKYQLPVFQPQSFKDESTHHVLSQHNADVMIVVAYGLLLPQAILDIPRYGCLNVHGSLLPRWRGAAPIQRAILGDGQGDASDRETGITIMQMDKGLDTGAMLNKSQCTIEPNETTASLHDKLMNLGAPALLKTLQQLQRNQLQPLIQDELHATYAKKISKEEACINWQNPAKNIELRIRAYNPFPMAFTFLDGQRIKIYRAVLTSSIANKQSGEIFSFNKDGISVACGNGALILKKLQLPGKKPMLAGELLNGYGDFFSIGRRFGS